MPGVVEVLILVPTGVNVRLPFRLFKEIFDSSLDILSQDIGESRNSRCVDIGIPQERKGQLMTGFVVGHHDPASFSSAIARELNSSSAAARAASHVAACATSPTAAREAANAAAQAPSQAPAHAPSHVPAHAAARAGVHSATATSP